MEVGVQTVFASHGWDGISDAQVYEEDTELALLADRLGYDCVWAVEHHFFDYSLCPDNTEWLAYLAGRTERIGLGTAAVILPWNEPLRVAEKISMLDHLCGGRLRFGMGRGLSRREYANFRGIGMEESRDRFDEAAGMITTALETGFMEGDGPYYPQPRTPIRPRPSRSFAGRLYSVANSDDSVTAAARLQARMVMFADRAWPKRLPQIESWRTQYRELNGVEAPPPVISDFVYCCADERQAEEKGPIYLATYLESLLEHYELRGDHFDELAGHEAYAKAANVLRRMSETQFLEGYLDATVYGTPDQILGKFRARYELFGPFEAAPAFRFGGIPFDEAAASLTLFAEEVLPEVRSW